MPGYSSSVSSDRFGNINAETGGQLPAGVVRQIQQSAAERGIATGTESSAANNAGGYLRDIGLNSLQLTNMGERTDLDAELPNLPGAAISQNPESSTRRRVNIWGATEASANLSNTQQQQNLAQANNERGLALARQGVAAGAAGAGVEQFHNSRRQQRGNGCLVVESAQLRSKSDSVRSGRRAERESRRSNSCQISTGRG